MNRMAKYTIQVKTIVESLSGKTESVGLSSLDEAIEIARTKIFDFDYPFYDPSQKADFEKWIPDFKKVVPNDYQRMLTAIGKYEEQGVKHENAVLEAFEEVTRRVS